MGQVIEPRALGSGAGLVQGQIGGEKVWDLGVAWA